jgi:hypothetical protein
LKTIKEGVDEEILLKFDIGEIFKNDYNPINNERLKKLDIPDYAKVFESFQGYSPLHIAIIRNDLECVRLIIEETNIDPTEKTYQNETCVHLACKYAVDI